MPTTTVTTSIHRDDPITARPSTASHDKIVLELGPTLSVFIPLAKVDEVCAALVAAHAAAHNTTPAIG